jgi:hypothetical protein
MFKLPDDYIAFEAKSSDAWIPDGYKAMVKEMAKKFKVSEKTIIHSIVASYFIEGRGKKGE